MGSSASDELIGTWVSGWAGARGYESRHEGRVHAALRHDTSGDWEYVIYEPSSEELVAVADTLLKHPARRLTAFADDTASLIEAARTAGLSVVDANEVLMVTDMAGHDVENRVRPKGSPSRSNATAPTPTSPSTRRRTRRPLPPAAMFQPSTGTRSSTASSPPRTSAAAGWVR